MKIGGDHIQFHSMTIYKSSKIKFNNPDLRNPPWGAYLKMADTISVIDNLLRLTIFGNCSKCANYYVGLLYAII